MLEKRRELAKMAATARAERQRLGFVDGDAVTDEEFEEYVAYALETRRRVKEQMNKRKRDDDFANFRRIALGFLEQYGKGGLLLISDSKGRILFSSTSEDTASLPPRSNMRRCSARD